MVVENANRLAGAQPGKCQIDLHEAAAICPPALRPPACSAQFPFCSLSVTAVCAACTSVEASAKVTCLPLEGTSNTLMAQSTVTALPDKRRRVVHSLVLSYLQGLDHPKVMDRCLVSRVVGIENTTRANCFLDTGWTVNQRLSYYFPLPAARNFLASRKASFEATWTWRETDLAIGIWAQVSRERRWFDSQQQPPRWARSRHTALLAEG